MMFLPVALLLLFSLENFNYSELVVAGIRILFLSLYFFVLWPKFRYPKEHNTISDFSNSIQFSKPKKPIFILLGIITAIVMILCSYIAVLLTGKSKLDSTLFFPPTSWNIIQSIIPGVFEEICFRGVLLSIFLVKFPNNSRKQIISSSLIFGLFHITNLITTTFEPTLIQIIISTLGGLTFGYLSIRTESIIPAMISHYLFDLFAPLILNAPGVNMLIYGVSLTTIGFLLSTLLNFKLINFFLKKSEKESTALNL